MFLISTRSKEQVSSGMKWGQRGWVVFALILTVGGIVAGCDSQGRLALAFADVRLRGAGFRGRRRAGLDLDGLQQPGRLAAAGAPGMVAGRRPAPAAPRLDPEPGGECQGLSRLRAAAPERIGRAAGRAVGHAARRGRPRLSRGRQGRLAIAERYPDFKASGQFLALQKSLVDTEQRIALARGYFNDIATHYNTRLEIVPERFVARLAAMKPQTLMAANDFEARR